ncbi:unnamed protein product [Taenia asiatica]|uniref:Uncharacterized protein n=1 Tax=Taenia asiatica TaxID=60517 RepID=A0A0R3VZH8_TAEAS|nr:unnamed protein product [Taenia asiatica]
MESVGKDTPSIATLLTAVTRPLCKCSQRSVESSVQPRVSLNSVVVAFSRIPTPLTSLKRLLLLPTTAAISTAFLSRGTCQLGYRAIIIGASITTLANSAHRLQSPSATLSAAPLATLRPPASTNHSITAESVRVVISNAVPRRVLHVSEVLSVRNCHVRVHAHLHSP